MVDYKNIFLNFKQDLIQNDFDRLYKYLEDNQEYSASECTNILLSCGITANEILSGVTRVISNMFDGQTFECVTIPHNVLSIDSNGIINCNITKLFVPGDTSFSLECFHNSKIEYMELSESKKVKSTDVSKLLKSYTGLSYPPEIIWK